MAMLADLASSDAARPNQAQEAGAVVPQLCRALDSGSGAASVEHASTGTFRRKRVCWSDKSFPSSASAAAAPFVPFGKTSKSRLPWPHVKLMLRRHLSRSKEKEWTSSHRKVDLHRGSTGDARCIYSRPATGMHRGCGVDRLNCQHARHQPVTTTPKCVELHACRCMCICTYMLTCKLTSQETAMGQEAATSLHMAPMRRSMAQGHGGSDDKRLQPRPRTWRACARGHA